MTALLILAASVAAMQPGGQDSLIHLKSSQVKLRPDWIISNHAPNGKTTSFVVVVLTDSKGQPREDGAMLIYGFCDVSTHAGLTAKELITAKHKGEGPKLLGDWELTYDLEERRSEFGLVIDAFRYLESHKAYLWVSKSRTVKDRHYKPTEEDYKEFAPYLERITMKPARE